MVQSFLRRQTRKKEVGRMGKKVVIIKDLSGVEFLEKQEAHIPIPIEERLYLSEIRHPERLPPEVLIYTGERGGKFIDRRQLRQVLEQYGMSEEEVVGRRERKLEKPVEGLEVKPRKEPARRGWRERIGEEPFTKTMNYMLERFEMEKDWTDLTHEEIREQFMNVGLWEEEARKIATYIKLFGYWWINPRYLADIEEAIIEETGNGRVAREMSPRYGESDLGSLSLEELREVKQVSEEIFEKLHGKRAFLYRGVGDFEEFQIAMCDYLGLKPRLFGVLVGFSTSTAVAQMFTSVGLVVRAEVSKEEVWSGYWMSDYPKEKEIVVELPKNGKDIDIYVVDEDLLKSGSTNHFRKLSMAKSEKDGVTFAYTFKELIFLGLSANVFQRLPQYRSTELLMFIKNSVEDMKKMNYSSEGERKTAFSSVHDMLRSVIEACESIVGVDKLKGRRKENMLKFINELRELCDREFSGV